MKDQLSIFSVAEVARRQTYKTGTLFIQDEDCSRYRAANAEEIIKAAQVAIDRVFSKGTTINSTVDSKTLFTTKLATRDQEVFACLFMNNRHQVIAYEELFFGTIDSSAVHPRQVVKRALFHNAATIIFAHNHPSGFAEPSRADEAITLRLKEALALIDVRVLDHIVVGGSGIVSLAERGIL